MKEGYIKKEDRKKILYISDDIRYFSGIATVSREIVVGTAHHYNYIVIGGAINHPDKGKRIDLSAATNAVAGIEDSNVILYPSDGYGNPDMVRAILEIEKPDALMFITDPRYYDWLFNMEHEIRQKVPMIYIQIWDSEPGPLYNKDFYRSVDTLIAISKQTESLNKVVLGDYAKDKIIKYIPHGINENLFYKMDGNDEKLLEFQKNLYSGKDYKFKLFFNSRNIKRKSVPDTIVAFKLFLDKLTKEEADKCCLVLHTHRVDEHGTDLPAVVDLFMGDRNNQVIFSNIGAAVEHMNMLYNSVDATVLLSSNEGWGLSLTESLMTETPIIANVTGGMQDQMRFEDENGNWMSFREGFHSNHFGKYKKCGEWALPVFPSNVSIQGSIPTPYITDDRCDFRDAAEAIHKIYLMSEEERNRIGKLGRDWVTSDESGMSASKMCSNMIETLDKTMNTWLPRSRYNLIKISDRSIKTLKNPLSL